MVLGHQEGAVEALTYHHVGGVLLGARDDRLGLDTRSPAVDVGGELTGCGFQIPTAQPAHTPAQPADTPPLGGSVADVDLSRLVDEVVPRGGQRPRRLVHQVIAHGVAGQPVAPGHAPRRVAAGRRAIVRAASGVAHDHAHLLLRQLERLGDDVAENGSQPLPELHTAGVGGDRSVARDHQPAAIVDLGVERCVDQSRFVVALGRQQRGRRRRLRCAGDVEDEDQAGSA